MMKVIVFLITLCFFSNLLADSREIFSTNDSTIILHVENEVGVSPLEVTFKVDVWDNNQLTFNWNFGDGYIASGKQTNHIFNCPGTYTVSLEVAKKGKILKTVSQIVTAKQKRGETLQIAPTICELPNEVAIKTNVSSGRIPLIVKFSTSIKGSNYHWNFGDGEIDDGAEVQHLFHLQGTYNVSLEYINEHGAEVFEEITIEAK